MKRRIQEKDSTFCPFADDRDESDPSELSLIQEATSANGLREFLIAMNGLQSPYTILAWGVAARRSTYFSYVEFSFRERRCACDPTIHHRLELLFRSWVIQSASDGEGLVPALLDAVAWEYENTSGRDKKKETSITLLAKANSEGDHARLMSWPATFLLNIFAPTLLS